jgi:hypothetical protein
MMGVGVGCMLWSEARDAKVLHDAGTTKVNMSSIVR